MAFREKRQKRNSLTNQLALSGAASATPGRIGLVFGITTSQIQTEKALVENTIDQLETDLRRSEVRAERPNQDNKRLDSQLQENSVRMRTLDCVR